MKLRKSSLAMSASVAAVLIAATSSAVAGTVLGGATVTDVARGDMGGVLIDGHWSTVIVPGRSRKRFDIVAANINLPAFVGGIDWHVHPGPTFGIVTGGGTLTVIDDDCVEHVYETGDAFVPPENPHTARNFSNLPVTIRATFFLQNTSPPTPPTMFVPVADDDVLDAHCGLID